MTVNINRKVHDSTMFIFKERLLLLVFFIRYFFVGVEYSVMLPSVLLYMDSPTLDTMFVGSVVCAYPIATMISLPLFGYLYDRSMRNKALLLTLNGFQIIGNIIYTLPFSKWLPVVGRFLAGLGDGFTGLVMGEITYLYDASSRISVLTVIELGRVSGIVTGPLLNSILAKKTYKIGVWVLDSKTLPYAVMAICWLLIQGISFLCTFNLANDMLDGDKTNKTEYLPLTKPENDDEIVERKVNTGMFREIHRDDELESDIFNEERESSEESEEETEEELIKESEHSYCSSLSQVLSIEFFVIFAASLVMCLSQTIFEILLPNVLTFDYKWNGEQLEAAYAAGGTILLSIFFCFFLLGAKCSKKEAYVIIFALILTQFSIALLMCETVTKTLSVRIGLFCVAFGLVIASVPLNLVCVKILLTNIMPPEVQGMVQGISSAISRIAMIGGPLLGGMVFKNRRTYGTVASILCCVALVALFCCVGRICRRQKQVHG